MRSVLSKTILTAAGALATLGVAAAPAAAAVPGTSALPICFKINLLSFGNGAVSAERYMDCGMVDPILLSTTIEREDVAGTWVTVASGVGFATHQCDGSALRTYRIKEVPSKVRTLPCG